MIRAALSTVVIWSAVLVLGVYLIINATYFIVHAASLLELRTGLRDRRFNPTYERFTGPFLPGIAVIIPAFNEAETIVSTVRSALDQSYPKTTVIVVNDGSTDDTLAALDSAYDLSLVDETPPWDLKCEPVKGIYRGDTGTELLVIDKENGGKADALNAGLWFTDHDLFCSVDADSIIDVDGLWQVVVPFLNHPTKTVAAGGSVRVANACTFDGSTVTDVRVSRRMLVGLQEIEYLRAFNSGRLGYAHLRSLLVISGTFGLFRTETVQAAGGYRRGTATEDLELVVRLHRYLSDRDADYHVSFVPEPVVWTQVPTTLGDLSSQRRRWYRGLVETAAIHRGMFGRRSYGLVGMVAFPLYLLSEGVGPLMETYGYVIVPLAFLAGIVNVQFFISFLLVIVGVGVFLSLFSLVSEVWGYRRYARPGDIVLLIAYAVLENVGYRQWKALTAFRGLLDYLQDRTNWGVIDRHAFETESSD